MVMITNIILMRHVTLGLIGTMRNINKPYTKNQIGAKGFNETLYHRDSSHRGIGFDMTHK